MPSRRSSAALRVVLGLWVVFGSWSLFRADAGEVPGLEPVVGHVVVFFFVALALLALLIQLFGLKRGLGLGMAGIVAVAAISEALQPILTETRQAQGSDFAGNLLGIAAASMVALISVVLLGDPSRRSWWTAGFCALGLVASAAITLIGLDRVQVAVECRDSGYDPIEAVAGEPIIAVEAQLVRLGTADPNALGDGMISDDSVDLRCSVLRRNELTISATVVPESVESSGPTRIFTSSMGTDFSEINVHVGQELDQLSVRVRVGTDFEWHLIPDVFQAGEEATVAMVIGDRELLVFVDGERRARFELVDVTFAEWDPDLPMLVGDEFTGNRTFEGEIERVLVFDRALPAGDPALG